jgi:hypothetical protein
MSSNPTLTVLQIQIEHTTFTSDETGYTVAKVKVYGRRDLTQTVLMNITENSFSYHRQEQKEILNRAAV